MKMNTSAKMTMFSYLAYIDCFLPDTGSVEDGVTKNLMTLTEELDFSEISWGPVAYKKSPEIFSDSLAYVVKNNSSGTVPEYTLVFRGTNPCSLSSWLAQDLAIAGMTPWTRQSPDSKAQNTWISKATDISLGIHKGLTDANSGKIILEWLIGIIDSAPGGKIVLNVTGHSLGGLMCSTFALWLHDSLAVRKLDGNVTFKIYSFAGPTAGNEAFEENLTGVFRGNLIRYANDKDIATHVWTEFDMTTKLATIYDPIKPNDAEKAALDFFCSQVLGLGYAQPGKVDDIPSIVLDFKPFKDYLMQALYQHVVPYLLVAFIEAPGKVTDIVIQLIENLFTKSDIYDLEGNKQTISVADRTMMIEEIKQQLKK